MTGLFVSRRSWRRSAGRGSIWGLVINRSNFPLCKTRALLGLIKGEYHRSQITRRRPHGERWPAAWRNHNPYSDRILTSTSRQIKKSRVSHSDSDFFHLNLSLNRKSPNHQTKKKSSRSFRFRLQITDERVRVMSKNRCFAKQKRRFWSHHSLSLIHI